MKTLVGLLLALLPALAAADERGSFVTLDRVGTDNVVGLAVSAHFADTPIAPDVVLRENLYGRYVDSSGFGAYGQFSIAHAFGNGDSQSAVGGLELGGLYVAKLDGFELVGRLGVGLPTASDDLLGTFTNVLSSLDRVEDYVLDTPHALWLRPGVAVRFGDRALFAQLDGGVDVGIDTSNGNASNPLFRASAGVGTNQGPIALTGEVANFFADSNGFFHYHSFAASARYAAGPLQPYVAYAFTLLYGKGDDLTAHSVTAGLQGTF
jgi:hypothetical protein